MNNEEIFIKVKKTIADVLSIAEEKITLNSKLIDDFGAESLDIMTLLIEFEDVFNKKIPDEEAVNLMTVDSIVNYIALNK